MRAEQTVNPAQAIRVRSSGMSGMLGGSSSLNAHRTKTEVRRPIASSMKHESRVDACTRGGYV